MKIEEALQEIAKFHFILAEGRKGNHLLFSPEMIRGAFLRDQTELRKVFENRRDEINQALNQTFSLRSFEEQKEYITTLSQDLQHALIFGYFELLEGEDTQAELTVH